MLLKGSRVTLGGVPTYPAKRRGKEDNGNSWLYATKTNK